MLDSTRFGVLSQATVCMNLFYNVGEDEATKNQHDLCVESFDRAKADGEASDDGCGGMENVANLIRTKSQPGCAPFRWLHLAIGFNGVDGESNNGGGLGLMVLTRVNR